MPAADRDSVGPWSGSSDPSDQQEAEAFELQLDTTLYRAALGARVTRVAPSLLDFLR